MAKKMEIQLFAVLREKLGDTLTLELTEKITSRQLLDLLTKLHPECKAVFMVSRVALDDLIINDDDKVDPDKTISILPPASGG